MTLYDINQQMEEAINRMFAEADENDGESKIGRASCRERV